MGTGCNLKWLAEVTHICTPGLLWLLYSIIIISITILEFIFNYKGSYYQLRTINNSVSVCGFTCQILRSTTWSSVSPNHLVLKGKLSHSLVLFYIFHAHPPVCPHLILTTTSSLYSYSTLWERFFDLILSFVGATESKHRLLCTTGSKCWERKNMRLLEEARKGEKIRSQNEFCTHLMLYSIFCYFHLLWQHNTI